MRHFVLLLPVVFLSFGGCVKSKPRSQQVYNQCVPCHGDKGQGMESVGAPAIAGLPVWYSTEQIHNFRKGARGGKPQDIAGLRMRPMAKTLYSEEDIKAVLEYVASLKPTTEPKGIDGGSVLLGKEAFLVCQSCHGENGEGSQAVNAPPLAGLDSWYVYQQLKNFKDGLRGWDAGLDANGAVMAGMAVGLDDKTMRNLVAYIATFKTVEVKP